MSLAPRDYQSAAQAARVATLANPDDCLTGGGAMGALMRSKDWASTPLGPVARWPQSLRTAVSICLGTSFPMLICWGPDLLMLYNDGYRPVLGTEKHPGALGQPLLECFSEIRELLAQMFGGVLRTGEPVGAEDMMFPLERNGYTEETYFVFSYSPIRDESGGVAGVLTTCTETTQRVLGERRLRALHILAERATHAKTAQEALREAAATFDPAEFPFSALYLLDSEGRRAQLVATTGLPAEAPRMPDSIALADQAIWPLGQVASTRKPELVTHVEGRLGRMPGGPWPEPATQALVLPITRPGLSHPYGFLVAGISPRRALDDAYRGYFDLVADHLATAVANARSHEEEHRRAEALAELDRAKTVFFSNVSHEFRTPLALMLGPLHELLSGARGPLDGPVREELAATNRNALRLLKLVNTLLDFARIEAGRIDAVYQPVDLARLTTDLAGVFRSAIERAGLCLVVECPPLPAPVHVDAELWEKIVLNLLSNAFKFTLEGEIGVALRWKGDFVELEVRDTGIGIAAGEIPNLFKRFHRVQGARSRSHEGSGIGLALVQDLVRLHGGAITVESEPGKGSSFKATVRTGTAHLPADRIGAARTRASTAVAAEAYVEEAVRWLPDEPRPQAADAPAAAPDASVRILIVDDNADMRAYLRRILGERWTVETVADGLVALESARRAPPDLILTDVMMPGLDGLSLVREIKAGERTGRIPVVMLSARAGEEARLEGLAAGADDYLIKPFSARELLARTGAYLSAARARRLVEQQRTTLYGLFRDAPAAISVVRGPDLVFEMVNERYLETTRKEEKDVIGRPGLEVFPELRGQGLDEPLREVMRSGKPYVGNEVPVRYDLDGDGEAEETYWNFVCAPLRDEHGRSDRVMTFSYEVTDQVVSRRKLEAFAAELEKTIRKRDEVLALLDTILATAPVGLAFVDRDLRCVRINDMLAKVNGVRADETVGKKVSEVVPPAIAAVASEGLRRVFETGEPLGPFEMSAPAPSAPAELKHWLVTYYPVRDGHGEVMRAGTVLVDITAQKRAELERTELLERERVARREADLQKQHLHALFMQAPTPICILRGPDHVVELANPMCCALWGRKHDEVIHRPLLEALPEVKTQVFRQLLDGVLRTGEPYVGKEIPARLGSAGAEKTVYFNFVYAPLRNASDGVEGILVIAFDVTDEIAARDELSRTIRYNEMFAGILGHDLRNPLSAIVTAAQLIMQRAPEPGVIRPASRILSSGQRMSRMIDQLLDFTRIRIGNGIRLQRKQLDLSNIVRRVVAEIEDAFPEREVRIEEEGDFAGEWDGDRLAQVVSNLAGNGLQHGSRVKPLLVSLDGTSPSRVTVLFANAGAIPQELLPVLFDPFREARHDRGNPTGLGLGLFITRAIVEAHGGQVTVTSTPAEGTHFTISLPRNAPPGA